MDQPVNVKFASLLNDLSHQQLSSPPSSLNRLADVELQLIMHGLDCKSLLRFAQCNRRMMQVADCSFAWKHMPSIVVQQPFQLARLTPPLLRHSPVSLRWREESCLRHPRLRAGTINVLLASAEKCRSPLHELDVWQISGDVGADQWKIILVHPSMQQLRRLQMCSQRCRYSADSDVIQLLIQLPHLQTLQVRPNENISTSNFWMMFAKAPSLSRLHITHVRFDSSIETTDEASGITIADQIKITHLYLKYPNLLGDGFRLFFTSAVSSWLQRLEYLSISEISQPDMTSTMGQWASQFNISADDYIASFAALRSLQTLELLRVADVHLILPHITHAPMLQSLILQPRNENAEVIAFSEGGVASSALIQVLQSHSLLTCTIILCPPDNSSLQASHVALVDAILTSESMKSFGVRVRLELEMNIAQGSLGVPI